jgi:hypothetical protein
VDQEKKYLDLSVKRFLSFREEEGSCPEEGT